MTSPGDILRSLDEAEAGLRFSDETHTYVTGGNVVVPSVTAILAATGLKTLPTHVPVHVLRQAAARGEAWHAEAETALTTGETVDPALAKYVAMIGREQWVTVATERKICAEVQTGFRVAGRVDALLARFEWGAAKLPSLMELRVVDFKRTAQRTRDHAVQVAGYAQMIEVITGFGNVSASVVYHSPFRALKVGALAKMVWLATVRQFALSSLPHETFFE